MSIHEYFGKFYFNTDTLTTAQYDQSKQITFRLIYGGIDREFLSIPFFKKTNDFIYSIWNQCKSKQYIKTPILGRHIPITNITGATANKVFNYYLQATETEVSVQKLNAVLNALGSYETKLILYTYDSILLDVPSTEVDIIIDNISMILQQGNFPVKIKQGHNYNKMIEINSNIVIA
jgi:DNA polymerase I-like protein with 3'-5' exonuclease and polymerase domains